MELLLQTRIVGSLTLALTTLGTLSQPFAHAAPFYRVYLGPYPGAYEDKLLQYNYGTKVLYAENVKNGPIQVDGVVWHSDPEEAKAFLGTRNPTLGSPELYELIGNNKWEEAKALMAVSRDPNTGVRKMINGQAVEDVVPFTENMANVLSEIHQKIVNRMQGRLQTSLAITSITEVPRHLQEEYLQLVSEELKARYPQGFFVKPVDGFSGEGTFLSEKLDFFKALTGFERDIEPQAAKLRIEGYDESYIHLDLKKKPFYSGKNVKQLMTDPSKMIIQEKLRPVLSNYVRVRDEFITRFEEYRVHIVEGRVLKGGTLRRFENYRSIIPGENAEVEAFAQSVIDRLSKQYRKMNFGLDVMRVEGGGFRVIEMNPGGESGFLYPEMEYWVSQVLASHYRGKPTPFLRDFEKFRTAPTLDKKVEILDRLLSRDALVEPMKEVEPMTEVLARAKNVLMDEVRKYPTQGRTLEVVSVIKKFKLEPYLSHQEIELVAGVLGHQAIDVGPFEMPRVWQLAEVENLLSLSKGEVLFYDREGVARLIRDFKYDEIAVEEKVLRAAQKRLENRPLRPEESRRVISELLDQNVTTRDQLRARPESISRLLKEAPEELSGLGGSRLFYDGTRKELTDTVLMRLLKSAVKGVR